ncbi:MAG: hypothetical protein NTX36_00060 [Proteobacteria bacterium]|nr:hypothetical protein [Pseudomonadota bacterium]
MDLEVRQCHHRLKVSHYYLSVNALVKPIEVRKKKRLMENTRHDDIPTISP